MKINKKAHALLVSQFTHNGKVAYSGIDTCTGTMPLWGQLVLAGLVKPMPYKSAMGHPFSYEITEAGRNYLTPSNPLSK